MTPGAVDIADQQDLLEVSSAAITEVVRLTLEMEGASGRVEVALVDDATIAALHEEFLGDPTPTDVITFALTDSLEIPVADLTDGGGGKPVDGEASLGEIVVSTETALRQAPEFLQDPVHETLMYVIHGVLHLLGYDDIDDEDRQRMELRQREIFDHWLDRGECDG